MKSIQNKFGAFFAILTLTLLFSSCLKDSCTETRTFIQFDPIYGSLENIRIPIVGSEARVLENPGKLYFYENFIFVNELREGLHIIDNADPTNPQNIGFIEIPGNVDLAIKDGLLYADNYMDILTIDITDPLNPNLKERKEDVYDQYYFQQGRGYLLYYRETELTSILDCTDVNFNNDRFWQTDVLFANAEDVAGGNVGNTGTIGVGGSFARFTLAKDHLYVVNESTLFTFDIGGNGNLEPTDEFYVGWGIETIFPAGEHLFIGSTSGLFIYSISNADSPLFSSQFNHARACDPVYVDGDRAYVTLRDGTRCQNFINQLDVLDVSDLTTPKLIKSFSMDNPHGVSKFNDKLFICEGRYGLKSFDATDELKIGDRMLDQIKDIHAYDVISLSEKHILVIGKDGLYQYDTSDEKNLKTISVVGINR